ncbi:MAG: pyruvate-formate lyase-activating enzyme [Paraglaciecola sp.]|jgi:pyruvate-formate lyase-activating enzyme
MVLKQSPFLLYADEEGNVFEDETLYAIGRSGWFADSVPTEDWIELPTGGSLYNLPDRIPLGKDVRTGEIRECDLGFAVAAFIPPAYTGLYMSSFLAAEDAETLPLFCYTAVGFSEEKFYVPAVRIEDDIRQEAEGFDDEMVRQSVENLLQKYPQNRLVEHLANNCALTYTCPAARNYFMGRWECPIPVSPACNSNCLGCISFQPESESITSAQDRLRFKPTAGEIVEYTVPHLESADFPIISFGQGCEGEPLLMWETIKESIIQIRKFTPKGSININTNGSMPKAVDELAKAGLNSIRVSTNSVQKWLYTAYYKPNNYEFEAIIESLKIMNEAGGWTSLNYFVFPGLTDSVEEYEALRIVIRETGLKMIQWRNFNIDPDWYMGTVGAAETGDILGVKQLMSLIKEEFPHIKYGYYNPPIERIEGNYEADFAQ